MRQKKIKLEKPFFLNGNKLEAGEHIIDIYLADALISRGIAKEMQESKEKPKRKRGE